MHFKSSFLLKIITLALVITAGALVVKLSEVNQKNVSLAQSNYLDKKVHLNEIQEILTRYDSTLLENKRLTDEIKLLKSESFSVDSVITDYETSLDALKKNIATLKEEQGFKSRQLEILNSILKSRREVFENNKKEIANLNATISKIESEINPKKEKKILKAINLNAVGTRVVSEKILETKKIKNTEQIKVCFTLQENNAIEKGGKDIFIQIINPRANIVSKTSGSIEFKNQTLFYSAKTNVNYEKSDVDVCVFVDTKKENLVKGDYIVNLFSGASLIGKTSFTLL